MIKISIIIPIYNVEKYIERCVRSLMAQTLREGIEFIFVDDCTPDNSIQILNRVLQEYPERKGQVKIITNDVNKGIYKTRCIGLDAANGDYIGWCDSDDWVEPDMYEKMILATNGGRIDVVVCDYMEYRVERTTMIRFRQCNTPIQCIEDSTKGRSFAGTLWNQIFRREILQEHIYDIVPTNYSEDTYIIWHTYCHMSSIAFIDEALYHYDKRNGNSLMHKRVVSYASWIEQKKNLQRIDNQCITPPPSATFSFDVGRYQIAVNFFKFWRKHEYAAAFNSAKAFFYTFREASKDIPHFYGMKNINNIKIYLANNIYLLYWLLKREGRG